MRFAKGHGTENDFVILLDPDGRAGLTGDLAARLCDRRAGIGGDGVLRAVRTEAMTEADQPGGNGAGPAGGEPAPEWFMDYRNADGTLAEMCGNGIRVFARYLAEQGLADGKGFTVATRSGPRRVRLEAPGSAVGNGGTGGPREAGWAGGVTVEMGGVAVLGPGSTAISGQTCEGLRVSVGNPHLACLVDAPLASFDLSREPRLDPGQFPEGGNVELVRLTGPRSVAMRVHERGSGETRSCGTGAVAAAAAAATATATGLGEGSWSVTVPGGELTVVLAGGRAWLTGPAVIVAEGHLDPAWLAAG
jgi:diaminopimelate epimerase